MLGKDRGGVGHAFPPPPTLRPSGLEMELRLRTEVALCVLSPDRQAWREGLALLGLPGQDSADLSRGFLWALGAGARPLLGVGTHWVGLLPLHPQTR